MPDRFEMPATGPNGVSPDGTAPFQRLMEQSLAGLNTAVDDTRWYLGEHDSQVLAHADMAQLAAPSVHAELGRALAHPAAARLVLADAVPAGQAEALALLARQFGVPVERRADGGYRGAVAAVVVADRTVGPA